VDPFNDYSNDTGSGSSLASITALLGVASQGVVQGLAASQGQPTYTESVLGTSATGSAARTTAAQPKNSLIWVVGAVLVGVLAFRAI
jgi:hypothetical protein